MEQEEKLIDSERVQLLQDLFCAANRVYLCCFDSGADMITVPYGSEAEQEYIRSIVQRQDYLRLVHRMRADIPEPIQEYGLDENYVKMCGVMTKTGEETDIIWTVFAVLGERVGNAVVPEYVMTTTEQSFYHSVELLEASAGQMFAAQAHRKAAYSAMLRSEAAEQSMKKQLHRLQTMTELLHNLELDDNFQTLAEQVIRRTCEGLGIDGGCLFELCADGSTACEVCEYVSDASYSLRSRLADAPVSRFPFMDEKPYLVSSNSMKPERFVRFFEECRIKALISMPMETAEQQPLMYLCFFECAKEREWESEDVDFINGVKQAVQGLLKKSRVRDSLDGSYASLKDILENTGCGIYVADDRERRILYMNQRCRDLFPNTIAAGGLDELLFGEHEAARSCYYEETYSVEEDRWLDVHKTQVKWLDGRTASLCTLHDITEKKLYQKEIESRANSDFLTGLFNRMRCEEDLRRFVLKAEEEKGEGALLYIDLDDFKHINDGLGHQYGDVLLKAISHSLQHIPSVENSCYRMGGDEFVILIPAAVYPELERIVQDVMSIFEKPWFLKGEDYYCTMSMGIVCFPTDGNTVDELVRKADMALLAAKRKGKNRIERYDDKDGMSVGQRLDMEKNMRQAAMNACDEFEVYYQPIVDVTAGMKCCGAEALVRWNSKELGFVRPDSFIPLAEYLGLINPIGEYVLKKAAKRCKYWNDMGHSDYKVNVNLSVVQLLQNDIVKKVETVLKETRMNPRNLTLEVTESLAINDMDRMKRILREIKSLGVKVALDDFGTGYSSLNHIREMPLDVIKIDRCFIEHLGEDDFSDAFVKMVAELAATIGVKVCVEGVETARQLEVLSHMNIAMIQGYYFGRPMPIAAFEEKYL